jgi:hypothetical protein
MPAEQASADVRRKAAREVIDILHEIATLLVCIVLCCISTKTFAAGESTPNNNNNDDDNNNNNNNGGNNNNNKEPTSNNPPLEHTPRPPAALILRIADRKRRKPRGPSGTLTVPCIHAREGHTHTHICSA